MTKDEAQTLADEARKWTDYACEYELGIVLNDRTVSQDDLLRQEKAFLALLNSMIDEPGINPIKPPIAAHFAPKITYITRCPACHAKIEWNESGTNATTQTPADLAAENALCNAAYLAKKTE